MLEQVVRDEHLAPDGNVDAAVDRLLQPNRIKVEPTELLKQVATRGPAARRVSALLRCPDARRGAARRRHDRARLRGGQLAHPRGARGRYIRVHRHAARGEQGPPRSDRRAAAQGEGVLHGPPAGADAIEPEHRCRHAAAARVDGHRAARRAGPPVDDRTADRRHAAGRRRRAACRAVRRCPAAQARVLQLQQELANARGVYTEKHPEIQRLQEDLAAAKRDAAADRERPEEDRLDKLRMDPGVPATARRPRDRAVARARPAAGREPDARAGRGVPVARRGGADGGTAARVAAARVRPREEAIRRPQREAAVGGARRKPGAPSRRRAVPGALRGLRAARARVART